MTDYMDESNVQGALAVSPTGRLKLGNDDGLMRLNEAAWNILERTGFKIYSKRILDKVAAFGAKVDYDTMIGRFPRELIEEAVDCDLRPETPDQPIAVPKDFQVGYGEVCFFLYDCEKQERRAATREEVIQLIRRGDAISEVTPIATPAVSSEIDQSVEAIESAELLMANTNKQAGRGIRCPDQVQYMHEIRMACEKHGGTRCWVQTEGCLTSPLMLGERSARIVEILMDLG